MRTDKATVKIWLRDAAVCVWRSWAVFFADFCFGIEFALFNMVFEPALRSWVHCETLASDSDPHLFSGSATCGDRKFVVQQAARLSGWLGAFEGSLSLLSMPLMGAYGDQFGRLPVLWVCIVGHAVSLLAISSSGGAIPIIVSAYIVRGLTGAFFSTFKAILGDMAGNRSLAYTVKAIFAFAGHALGWFTGLCILRFDLVDYTVVWWLCILLFATGAAIATQIIESLPIKLKSDRFQFSFLLDPIRFLIQEPFMRRWCAAKFLIVCGVSVSYLLKSFVLAVFAWRQGSFEALMGIAGAIGGISTFCAPELIRRYSTQVVVLRSVLLLASATSCLVLAPIGPVFCLLPLLAKSSGACGYTASTTLLADKYIEAQGKSTGAVLAVGHMGQTLGHLLYASLFNAKATSVIAQAQPFLVAAPLTWVGYACLVAAMRVRKQPEVDSVKGIEIDL